MRKTKRRGTLTRQKRNQKMDTQQHCRGYYKIRSTDTTISSTDTTIKDKKLESLEKRRITLLREGYRGSLSEKIMKKYNLREKVQGQHQTYALGIKEVWEIDSSKHEPGHVLHTLGWPLDNRTYGGSFLYHMKDRQVSLGNSRNLEFTLRLISFGYDYHWVFLYMHAMFWNPQKSWSAHIKEKLERMGNLLCCVQVDQSTIAIKERFGKFDEVLEPGCHFMPWCLGRKVAGHLTLRLQQLDVRCETKTKDNVFVNVVASIQYRALANKGSDAFYRLSNTRTQIQAYVFDGIDQSKCSKAKPRHDAFEQKNEIARAVEDELEKAMSAYGYEIVQTLIVDIEPDEHVKRAMNEINAAARLRVAANEKAEAEKIVQIKRAEGDAESKYLAGLGIARQRQAIVDGLRESVLGFSVNVPGTTAKDVMDMVLITQYFDTMKEIGASSKSSAVFIPHGPGPVREIAEQIRDGLLQASSAQQEATLLYGLSCFETNVVQNKFVFRD
ncbi:unnamed protein product [Camellia sinensis]